MTVFHKLNNNYLVLFDVSRNSTVLAISWLFRSARPWEPENSSALHFDESVSPHPTPPTHFWPMPDHVFAANWLDRFIHPPSGASKKNGWHTVYCLAKTYRPTFWWRWLEKNFTRIELFYYFFSINYSELHRKKRSKICILPLHVRIRSHIAIQSVHNIDFTKDVYALHHGRLWETVHFFWNTLYTCTHVRTCIIRYQIEPPV